jgi:hypothetical protein
VVRIALDHVVEDDRGLVVVADAEVDLRVDGAAGRHVAPAAGRSADLARPVDAARDGRNLAVVLAELGADLAHLVGRRRTREEESGAGCAEQEPS